MRTLGCAGLMCIVLAVLGCGHERGGGYYRPARMAILNRNLEKYDWARAERDRIIKAADAWLKYDDATLRTLVVPPEVPRSSIPHDAGAPVNGAEQRKLGRYSWKVSFDRPYKVVNPADGKEYPSNDFVAFMKSGYKDRSLLTGPYADDGWGCKVEGFDKPFWFVAVYAQWSVTRLLLPAVDNLSQAYLLTGDARYAHACAVLLWQMAEYYPRYFFEKQSRYGKEVRPDYLGRILYHTWEALYTCHSVPPAYDAVRPAIGKDKALMAMTGQTADEIKGFIEDRMLRTMANDIMDGSGRIEGNYGMHQVGLLRIAAALEGQTRKPTSAEMREWVLRNPGAKSCGQLGMEDALNNLFHRDGYPFESPSYNCHWMKALNEMVESLGAEGRRILAMPRFRKSFEWPVRMACAGEFVPSYGDSNTLFHGPLGWFDYVFAPAYRHYRDPMFAKALKQINAKPGRNLFEECIEEELVEAAEKRPEPLGVTSELLPGVGFASLQCGSDANRTAVALFYGFYQGHLHVDRLTMDLYSWRNTLLPDFGYPETADSYDPRRYGFFAHTVSHNTVMVDARQQAIARGRLTVYDPGDFAQVVEVSGEPVYPGKATLYRRTLMLVEVSPTEAYVVDIFRIRGGDRHDWLVHGTQAAFSSDMAFSVPRKEGTLAGADVPYGYFYDDKRYDNNNAAHVPYYLYGGSGFQWLFNVQQAPLDGVGSVTWALNRPPKLFPPRPRAGVSLRAHLVGRDETVFACDGKPQHRKDWPETVKFVCRNRQGKNLESVFVTVFEPYKDSPFIRSVKPLPVADGDDMPVALEIALKDRTHVIYNRLENGAARTLPGGRRMDARATVLELAADDLPTRTYTLDALHTCPVLRSRVAAVNVERREITLADPVLPDTAPAGGMAIVGGPLHGNAVAVSRVVSPRAFAVEDDDLAAGTFDITGVDGEWIDYRPNSFHYMEAGMTLYNEAGRAVAKLVSVPPVGHVIDMSGRRIRLDRAVTLADFPDADQNGRRTCKVLVLGPGDDVTLHRSLRTQATR